MTCTLIPFSELSEATQLETRHWRNSEAVVPYFRIKYIDEEMHRAWLASLSLPKPRVVAFAIRVGVELVGVTYFHTIDYDARCADWGIYIHIPQARGQGIGRQVLEASLCYARESLGLTSLFLDVAETNSRARHLYEAFGFAPVSLEKDFYRYCLDLR